VNSCLADPDCAPVKRPGRGPSFIVAPPGSSPINAADDASKGAAEDAVVGEGWEGDVQGRNGDDGCSACSCNGGLLTCSDIECRSPGVSGADSGEGDESSSAAHVGLSAGTAVLLAAFL